MRSKCQDSLLKDAKTTLEITTTTTIPTTTETTAPEIEAEVGTDTETATTNGMALDDLSRERATLAEKEVTSLKEQLANHGGGGSSSSGAMAPPPPDREDPVISTSQHKNQDFEIAAKDKEISNLVEDVQRLQASLNQIRESSATQIRLLEEQLDQKQEVISRLETRLDTQRDYEEMKRELARLKGSSTPSSNTNNNELTSVNGVDAKDVKDKRPSSPMNALNHRFLLGPAAALPVEAFGSLLGEEIVATWRRSLERSLLSSSPPLHLHNSNLQSSHHHHMVGGGNNDSSSPPPQQQSSPNESSMNDSSINMDSSGLMNGNTPGPNERLPFRFEDSLIPKSDPMEGRLQEMLRYNMDKFGSQCLDTLQIARRVRELLSIHNIGQRLFAKYVLGLSQGTVSELLSKPKPWDKLTEKGRDSYRKMHAWSADEASVLLLKSLIPKKGKEGGGTPGGNLSSSFRCEDSGAEDRIAHILSEANQALHRNQLSGGGGDRGDRDRDRERGGGNQGGNGSDRGGNQDFCDDNAGSKSPASNHNGSSFNGQCPPSPSGSSSRDRRLRKYENDDISQEQVARIYQEELAKLVGIRLPQGAGDPDPRIPREHFQSLLFPHLFGSSLLERDDIRMALDAYHRELAKLTASSSSSPSHFPPPMFHPNISLPNGIGGAQDLSMPKRLSPSETKDRDSEDKFDKEESNDVMRHVGSAFSLVRPKTESNSGAASPSPLNSILPPSAVDDSSNASPLQRMASITNSLISQPTAPSVSSPNQRPLKAVLPPITQQQFDQYNNLNTEDIVRKVKEQLSQYSISQRLFGESVLGLSQGSVSDLLARPKPWHMLTQKGREPFIRMKMFLEDENAVHKLVASQYKIAPEKLMRTGGYAGNPSPATASKAPAKVAELPKSLDTSPLPPPPPPIIPPPQTQPSSTNTSNLPMAHDLAMVKREQHKSSSSQGSTTPSPVMLSRPISGGLPQQPSVYEMAALTQDLDTQLITTKIKEALLANNIGQKIFGEVVLGLSQGSVSELLSKPKPWHMLSIKGREPFIRMQLWLADPLNVERLQHLKNERREANKRKRGLPHSASPLETYTSGAQGGSSEDASNDSPNDNESFSPGSNTAAPPNKKQRVLFSDEQKEALRLAFALDPYPNVSAIEFLARELILSSRTITNWFHNHRMRLKQQTSSPLVQDTSLSSQPFDPVQFRLLLHQRLVELHKDKYPVLPFFNNQQSSNSHALEEGLDLTVSNTASRIHSDNDDDFFEEVEEEEEDMEGSIASDDSGASEGSKPLQRRKRKSPPKSTSISSHTGLGPQSRSGVSACNLGSSRRKPVAPQWFNPSWHDDSDDEEVLINGVCVLQNSLGIMGKSGTTPAGGAKDNNNSSSRLDKDESASSPLDLNNSQSGKPPSGVGGGGRFKTEPDEDEGSAQLKSDDDEDDDEGGETTTTKTKTNTKATKEEDHLPNDKDSDENNDICIKSGAKIKVEIDHGGDGDGGGEGEPDEPDEYKSDTENDTD